MMKRNSGFTLLEILVVISIIIILAGLLMPAIGRANRQAKKAECMNNLRQIGMAIQQYALDNNGSYPTNIALLTTTPSAADPYLPVGPIINCPGSNTAYSPYTGSGFTTGTATASTVILQCPSAVHPGTTGNIVNTLYGDGHVGAPPATP